MPSFGSASATATAESTFWDAPDATGLPALSIKKDLSLATTALDIAEAPTYFERNSSFFSAQPPPDILQAVSSLLASQSIDFTYTPSKHKITGVVIAHNAPVRFVVRVWKKTSDAAYLIEFQRRSGCVVTFTQFYRACTASLSHLIIAPASPTAATPALSSPTARATPFDLNGDEAGTGSVTLDEQTFDALSAMASSADSQCASEGMRALVNCSAAPANCQFIAEHSTKALAALRSSSSSSSSYLQLLAAKLAVALAHHKPLRNAIVAALPLVSTSSSSVLASDSDLLLREAHRTLAPLRPQGTGSKAAAPAAALHSKLSVLPALRLHANDLFQ